MIVSSDRLHPLYRRTNAFLKCGPFTTSFNSQLSGAFKGLVGFPARATSLKLITAAVFTQLRFSSDSRNWMCKMLNAPAADRNKDPILSVLKSRVKSDRHGNALEISSGTGQHVVHFANALPNITWQPSEVDSHSLSSIEVYRQHYRLPNVKPAIYLDASQSWETWYGIQPESCELIVNINMMHISPLACTKGLFNGVGKILKPQGLLLIYGPYSVNGTISPQSNVDFDHSLRSRNPDWGLRDIAFLTSLGQDNGLRLEEIVDMPANNKCLLFRKDSVV